MDRLGMKSTGPATAPRSGAARWVLALGLVAASTLTACQSSQPYAFQAPPLSTEDRFPIVLRDEPVILEIPVASGSYALTEGQRAEISAFMRAYRDGGSSPLVVRTPSGTRNEVAAMRAVEEIRALAARADVPTGAVKYHPYGGRKAGTPYPPIVLSYSGIKAQTAECGDWSENVGANYRNKPYLNFGCSSQQNLAAMASNPRDLVTPRAMDPASTERRQTVRDKYILGQPTGTVSAEEEQSGTASEVGQ
jgi:pilus assembly protein CpaD